MTRILVVEDDPETLDMITIMLERKDYEVLVAKNGQEGADRAGAGSPDLIVTDIKMPILNGIEMIKRLRSGNTCSGVPIIAVTAYLEDVAKDALRAGASRVLAKPFSDDKLQVLINDLLLRRS